jgi:DNA-binding MarR family transcriptional regulator
MAPKLEKLLARAPLETELPEGSDPALDGAPLDLSQLSNIVGYPLRRAQLAVFEDFARRFAPLGLTPAQYSTLSTIGDNPGRNQSEIAEALGILRPNFVTMMDELEGRGLAERSRSGADRRAKALALTTAGRELLARARVVQGEQEAAIDQILGRGEREALVDALQKLATLA